MFVDEKKIGEILAPSLPTKPSALIRVALADLRKVEADPRYKVDMAHWHAPATAEFPKCIVCLAGAVLAKTINFPITESVFADEIFRKHMRTLFALNDFRLGLVQQALVELGIEFPKEMPKKVHITDYAKSPAGFHKDMNELADYLEMWGY